MLVVSNALPHAGIAKTECNSLGLFFLLASYSHVASLLKDAVPACLPVLPGLVSIPPGPKTRENPPELYVVKRNDFSIECQWLSLKNKSNSTVALLKT